MRTRIVGLLVVVGLLATEGSASAGTNKLSGVVKNSEGQRIGTISMKVTTSRSGVATRVGSVKLKGLKSQCLSEDGVSEGNTVTASLAGSAKVKKVRQNGKTVYGFQKMNMRGGGTGWYFAGALTGKAGRGIKEGRIEGSDLGGGAPGSRCSVLGNFTAKAKK